jgi:hypothetical protein
MSTETVPAAIVTIANAMPALTIDGESRKVRGINPLPATWPTAHFPGLYVLTGAATDDEESAGDDQVRETRLYRLQVPFMAAGGGTPDERETRGRPLLTAVKAWFRKYPHLGTAHVESARVLGDSGIVILPEYDGANIGFEIRLQVTELVDREYADLE